MYAKNIIHETNIPGISRINPAIRLILDWADIGQPNLIGTLGQEYTPEFFPGVMSPKN